MRQEEGEENEDYLDDFEDYVSEPSRPATAHREKDVPTVENRKESDARTSKAVAKSALDSQTKSIKLPLNKFPPNKILLQPTSAHDDYACRPSGPPSHRPSAPPTHRPKEPPHHRPNDAPVHRPTEPPSYRLFSTPRYRPTQQPRHRPPGPPAHQPADLMFSGNTKRKESRQVPAPILSACTRALDLDLDDGVATREPAAAKQIAVLLATWLSPGSKPNKLHWSTARPSFEKHHRMLKR
eukprot:TRINITY_DN30486_c0_g1_i3.p1 TRINITY_DN30486_c0_g1~~TRINITY_DN30486_c0_g1_i3.p1  ORF type:complete len:239 (-),score=23.30 TRINITY_DN30486_c0_g1_i3:55-771(-)